MKLNGKWALSALIGVTALAGSLCAADGRITNADERFRLKYGVYPPHVRQMLKESAATQTAGKTDAAFGKADKDRDGMISRAEWRSSDGLFDTVDADGDGRISAAEWKARGAER